MRIILVMRLILFFGMMHLFSSCSLEKLGASAGKGLSSQSDTIGANLVHGVVTELTDPKTQKKIRQFLDSIITSATDTLTYKTMAMRDSLINRKIIIWADSLVEALTGNRLRLNVEKIQLALIGKTKTDVLELKKAFNDLLQQILSQDTKGKLGAFRDELLGDKTNLAITKIADTLVSHIVDSAIVKLSKGYRKDINPLLEGDISFVNKNAKSLLITLGAIACAIILLVWRSREKYLRLTTLLTKQINGIPDQRVYDKVTTNIKSDALTAGLEGQLRALLQKNGLLGHEAWKAQMEKLMNSAG